MAYSYVDGAYSSEWLPSGSSVKRKIKARLWYQVSETATTYTISVYGQETVYKDNFGVTIKGTCSLTGATSSTGSHVYKYSSSGTNHTDVYYTICSTISRTWNKTTSTQSASASMYAYREANSAYNSTASRSFSIPALTKYNVVFDANGHGTAPATQGVFHGYKATQPTAPTATGYTFGGWYTEAACTNLWNWNNTITAGRTLYAKWTPNEYNVIYNANGGTGEMSSSTFTYDQTYSLPANTFNRTDYLFAGWTPEDGGVIYRDGDSVTSLIGSGTYNLYATWEYQFTRPDLQEPLAWRREQTQGGQVEDDDAGTAGKVQLKVEPAKMKTSLSGSFEYIDTQIFIQYKELGATNYISYGTPNVISTPSTISWNFPSGTFATEKQYDILLTAVGLVNNVQKANNSITTFISTAEFTLDINANGTSLGLFEIAPGVYADNNDTVKTLGLRGDLLLQVDEHAGEGYLDYIILSLIENLGWDITVNPSDVTT